MKRYLILLLFAILVCIYSGCVNDKSNTSIDALNTVSVSGLDESYTALLNEYLIITPTVTTVFDDSSQLSYVWYIYTPTTLDRADTLGHQKDLNAYMDPAVVIPGAPYTLALKVIDNSTGVYYRYTVPLSVETKYTRGTLLLCETANKAQINFMQLDSSRTVLTNVFALSNHGDLVGSSPQRIYAVNPVLSKTSMSEVMIMCNDTEGGCLLNPSTFVKNRSVASAVAYSPNSTTFNPQEYFNNSQVDYVTANGQVCKRALNASTISWEPPLVATDGATTYFAEAPTMLVGNPLLGFIPVYFDSKHGRLLTHATWNMGSLNQLGDANNDTTYFDCNRMGSNMRLLASGFISSYFNQWMLFQDTVTNVYSIYEYQMVSDPAISSVKWVSMAKIALNNTLAPHIGSAIAFTSNIKYKNTLFYATANGVYAILIGNLNTNSSSSVETPLVDAMADNFTITGMKLDQIGNNKPPTNSDPYQLRLMVQDKLLSSQAGGVAFYEITAVGGLSATQVLKRTGFCDVVIDCDEKYN